MTDNASPASTLGTALRQNRAAQLAEILSVFFVAFVIIAVGRPFAGDNPVLRQTVVWIANVAMLSVVWLGLRLRGQRLAHIGLISGVRKLRTLALSLVVFVAAMIGFAVGSIVMANIVGIPQSADMSGYNYLQGNLPMLVGALLAVFVVSSFGEEVIYRGFLITRIAEMGGSGKTWSRIAVLISAIVFGLVHFQWGPMGIVQTGFMGLALGISFILVKRNLWILVLAHAYMDAILMIQMYLGKSQ